LPIRASRARSWSERRAVLLAEDANRVINPQALFVGN
jgi:hypothetical protein